MLHKKELVLNQNQTRDIFDTVSIIDKAKSQADSVLDRIRLTLQGNNTSNSSSVFGDIYMTFDKFRGSENDAEEMAKRFMKKINKKK